MELIIKTPDQGRIEWNQDEIKKEIQEKVEMYGRIVYDDDQIKEAKKDRADLNRLLKEIDERRKTVKNQYLAPYNEFEKQVKEVAEIIKQPIAIIDSQTKAFEEKQKAEKDAKIREYASTLDLYEFEYEQIENPKWLNATTPMKTIKEELDAIASEIKSDLEIIEDLPEYSFEALEVYKKTRDLRSAISEHKRLVELEKARQEYEAKKEAEKIKALEASKNELKTMVEEIIENSKTDAQMDAGSATETVTEAEAEDFLPDFDEMPNEREWKAIKIYATPDDIEALKQFLNSRMIPAEFL